MSEPSSCESLHVLLQLYLYTKHFIRIGKSMQTPTSLPYLAIRPAGSLQFSVFILVELLAQTGALIVEGLYRFVLCHPSRLFSPHATNGSNLFAALVFGEPSRRASARLCDSFSLHHMPSPVSFLYL